MEALNPTVTVFLKWDLGEGLSVRLNEVIKGGYLSDGNGVLTKKKMAHQTTVRT